MFIIMLSTKDNLAAHDDSSIPLKRKPGRPRKAVDANAPVASSRRVGRPRHYPVAGLQSTGNSVAASSTSMDPRPSLLTGRAGPSRQRSLYEWTLDGNRGSEVVPSSGTAGLKFVFIYFM